MINTKYQDLSNFVEKFRYAKPFPYLILDNFFTDDFFKKICSSTNKIQASSRKVVFNSSVEEEKIIYMNQNINFVKKIIKKLSDDKWLEQLKILSGINDVSADDVNYSGLSNYHEMNSNGILGSHIDHSFHDITKSKHVINIIIYLSHDWNSSYGGNTLLFNSNGKKVEKKIEYIPNRALIFLHTPYSFHGVDRINQNLHVKRKTFYIDYYSKQNNPFKHLNLSFKNHYFPHSTVFVMPELKYYLNIDNIKYFYPNFKYNINKVLKNLLAKNS